MTNLPVGLIIDILHNVDLITLLRCQQVSAYVLQDLHFSTLNRHNLGWIRAIDDDNT